ncbi:hypothetical protein CANCADRAFT_84943 [Tortispora caseinolytica NRRL Y-17796]|uniref:SAM-dependent MTase RsmB/NOP-type domain-containing protein n=1 Tax=Tortispora caseinolytica NRRL Y-17796 TaxID=767744 RepID=A0A1E4TKQ4_9ASCO|nr:hypothetical protein CANCADRAFT_84943 [Tortispora caseinolytica NRRL Y-17796]
MTFRVTGSQPFTEEVRNLIKNKYEPKLQNIVWEGQEVQPPVVLPWYPGDLALQMNVGKHVIRKNKPFADFQKFLVAETNVGHICRQEAVSMIPPIVLDVKPHHTVIDLCAAPGSKTAQLLEFLHDTKDGSMPTGLVIANDSDAVRSHMLVHQVKRLASPNLIVSSHDAQLFPKIKTESGAFLQFDRVLADVPCSGDATMRKNINVWRDWNTGNGIGLHQTQLNILMRGVKMLKPGGRIVYSTCSLNPVENEAVVAEALRLSKGKLKLVDASSMLPGLKFRPGLSSWKVMNKSFQWITEPEEKHPKSLFPPAPEETELLNLNLCMRVYPHLQDTGGFFIAVFELEDDGRPSNKKQRVNDDDEAEPAPKPEINKKKLPRDANEEPFRFVKEDHEVLDSCYSFYDIKPEFARKALFVRNATGEPARIIYYLYPELRQYIELNEGRLKLVHAGIKMFAIQKNPGECQWRVQYEGLRVLFPYLTSNRVVRSGLESLKFLCENAFPKLDDIQDSEFKENVSRLSVGCAFLVVDNPESKENMLFPLWRGQNSINLMLPREDTMELLLRVFDIHVVINKGDGKAYAPKDPKPAEIDDKLAVYDNAD